MKYRKNPNGLAEAFIIGEEFIGDDNVALILGDNVFHGHRFSEILKRATRLKEGAIIFGYYTKNPKHLALLNLKAKATSYPLKKNHKIQNPII